jgi:tRNA-splicing ligase RtcB
METKENNLTVFGKEIIDEKAILQLENCLIEDSIGVLTADAHYGYSMPVGGCVAYKNHISPSGVGFDIACGNYAVRTDIKSIDINIKKVMDEIMQRISFGVGRPNNEPVDHPLFDKIDKAEFEPQRKLLQLAKTQLGTIGSGNHFVDIFEDENGFVWVGVHFGSRGFGHKTASGFLALAQGKEFDGKVSEGSMDSKPTLFDINSQLGQDYINAMHLAGEYAYAGRETAVNKVLEILGAQKTFEVHNHHNFAWLEEHFGEKYWVVRKGCTPAMPGQLGFIGANMMDMSVIIEGVDSELSKKGLYSTVHGAGRILSRTQAAGKQKWMKGEDGRKRPVRIEKGLIDFDVVKNDMKENKIELRGAGPDEAPGVYKNLEEVLSYQGETIKVLHRLKPIGVAMAGETEFDPYKD